MTEELAPKQYSQYNNGIYEKPYVTMILVNWITILVCVLQFMYRCHSKKYLKKHKELRLNANENNMTVKEVCGKHVKFLVK